MTKVFKIIYLVFGYLKKRKIIKIIIIVLSLGLIKIEKNQKNICYREFIKNMIRKIIYDIQLFIHF